MQNANFYFKKKKKMTKKFREKDEKDYNSVDVCTMQVITVVFDG